MFLCQKNFLNARIFFFSVYKLPSVAESVFIYSRDMYMGWVSFMYIYTQIGMCVQRWKVINEVPGFYII